jgi:hypothetical protein
LNKYDYTIEESFNDIIIYKIEKLIANEVFDIIFDNKELIIKLIEYTENIFNNLIKINSNQYNYEIIDINYNIQQDKFLVILENGRLFINSDFWKSISDHYNLDFTQTQIIIKALIENHLNINAKIPYQFNL